MLKAESANSCSMQMISALREIFIFFDESNFNKLSKIADQQLKGLGPDNGFYQGPHKLAPYSLPPPRHPDNKAHVTRLGG
jgi:hypothetical protein